MGRFVLHSLHTNQVVGFTTWHEAKEWLHKHDFPPVKVETNRD